VPTLFEVHDMPRIKLTARALDKLTAPDPSGRQVLYWDSALKGLGVLVSGKTNAKTFVQRDVNGRSRRVTIGPVNVLSVEDARKQAEIVLADFYKGIDPKAGRRGVPTLRQTLDAYLTARGDNLRPLTHHTYRQSVERYLTAWLDWPLNNITPELVEQRHRSIQSEVIERGNKGNHSANYAMTVLRTLWNFATERTPNLPANPMNRLKRARFPEPPSTRRVKAEDLPAFYAAVNELPNPIHRHYLLLLLFTGLRRTEAASLRWESIDFHSRVIRLPASVTKAKRPLDLPMSDVVHDVLVAHRAIGQDKFVFPSASACGYFVEPQYPLDQVAMKTGIRLSAHDLRRNYVTVAESSEISFAAVKGLVNHSLGSGMTERYIGMDIERLRVAAQCVADKLKALCGMTPVTAANVAKLQK
jgi:integrase